MVSFLLSVCRSEPIGLDHKHFAIARWPRCTASRLLAKPKENAPWHEGGSAAGVFPYRSAVDPKFHMAQNHPPGWFLFVIRMSERTHRVRPQAFEARERCGCICSRGFDVRVKTNAPWHEGGSAAGVFPYRSAVDPKFHMAQNHPPGWFLFVIRMSERTHRVRPQAFEARERCGCICSRGFDARVKTNAQWHAAGLAGRCLKIECRCVIML